MPSVDALIRGKRGCGNNPGTIPVATFNGTPGNDTMPGTNSGDTIIRSRGSNATPQRCPSVTRGRIDVTSGYSGSSQPEST